MKKNIIYFFLLIFIYSSFPQETVKIDPNDRKQIIKGWGTSLAWWANIMGDWGDTKINDVAFIATDPNQLNLNVFRFNIGGGDDPTHNHMRSDGGNMPGYRAFQNDNEGCGTWDPSSDYRQIKVMNALAAKRNAVRNDIITELFSCSPPYYMTKSGCSAGSVDGYDNIHPNYYDDFADYLATVTKGLRDNYPAWNINYLEAFNESLSTWWIYGGNQEGCYVYPSVQAIVLWNLWSRMNAYGIWGTVKLTVPDCNTPSETSWNMWYLWQYHRGEYDGVSKINTHTYSGTWQEKDQLRIDAQNDGKELWQSETGPIGIDRQKAHFVITNRQIEDLRNLQCDVWFDWQLVSTTAQWGLLQYDIAAQTYEKTKSYYTRSHINRFIKQGYQIIGSSNGNFIAAADPANTETIIVVVNQNASNKRYTIDLSSFDSARSYVMYRTTGVTPEEGENLKAFSPVNIKNKKLTYTSPGYSVTTFVVSTSLAKSAGDSESMNEKNIPEEFSLKAEFSKSFQSIIRNSL
jgi:O-glycosyl hydrolase